FEALKKELSEIGELRFLFTSPLFLEEKLQNESREFYIPNIIKEADICGGDFELRLRNELTQRYIAKECANWIRQKVKFKSITERDVPLMMSMIHNKSNEGINGDTAYINTGSFNTPDIGISP